MPFKKYSKSMTSATYKATVSEGRGRTGETWDWHTSQVLLFFLSHWSIDVLTGKTLGTSLISLQYVSAIYLEVKMLHQKLCMDRQKDTQSKLSWVQMVVDSRCTSPAPTKKSLDSSIGWNSFKKFGNKKNVGKISILWDWIPSIRLTRSLISHAQFQTL